MRVRDALVKAWWRIVNPLTIPLAGFAPWWVVLETTGRRTGRRRRVPLARGPVDGRSAWLIAVRGTHAGFAHNIAADPRVRLKMRGRWRSFAQVRRTMIGLAVIGVVMMVIAGGAMMRKVALLGDNQQFNRTVLWRSSLAVADASPWLGWGLGSYADIYAAYQPDEIRLANDKAHSTPIELYVEAGVLGAVPGVLMVMIAWGVCLAGALRRRRQRYLLVAAVAVSGIAVLHSAVDFSLQIPAIAFIAAAFLGMGWAQTFYRLPVQEPSFTPVQE